MGDNIPDNTTDDKLIKLRQLLEDYSYPEKIYKGMLNDIDTLLTWAIQELIHIGISEDEVRTYLGDPFVEISPNDSVSDWLYPCLFTDGDNSSREMDGNWFYDLQFRGSILISINKRKWRLII